MPIGWVRRDSFIMIPGREEICFDIQGGDHWPLRFTRADDGSGGSGGGQIVSVTLDGMGLWPGVLHKELPHCTQALESACGDAKRASTGNCFVCASSHQQALHAAGCSEACIDSFCT
jgi:hypothetical protein